MAKELNAHVAQRIEVAPGLIVFRLLADGWEFPDFKPGQYGVLGLPPTHPRCEGSLPEPQEKVERRNPDRLIQRAYSIASSPLEEYLEILLVLVEDGELTPRLCHLKCGDQLYVGPKIIGKFTLDDIPEDKNLVMVATGTGLAPFMSMIRTFMNPDFKRHVTILHGVRYPWDLAYRGELLSMARSTGKITYIPTVSRAKKNDIPWSGEHGYVQRLWSEGVVKQQLGYDPTPDDTHFMLCGSPNMIEDLIEELKVDGFKVHTKKEPGQVHFEKYW